MGRNGMQLSKLTNQQRPLFSMRHLNQDLITIRQNVGKRVLTFCQFKLAAMFLFFKKKIFEFEIIQ